MLMKKEVKNVPELRFQEFDDDWSNKILQDITKINQGLQIAISERKTEPSQGGHFYITNEFLRENSKTAYYIDSPSQSVLCGPDDLLMTRTGNTGQVVTGVSGAFHNNFFKIKYNSSCEKRFLYYFLTSHKTQHTILKLAGTSTIPDLNHDDFYKIKIDLPNLLEQQKIASFLAAVDKKLKQLSRKKELLEQYKKGVMQKIFSQEIRFKDDTGQGYPDWEEKRLGDVATFLKGKGISKEDVVEDGKLECIRYGELYTKYSEIITTVSSSSNIQPNGLELSKKNDVIIPSSGETHIDLATASCVMKDGVALGGDINIIRTKENGIFLSYYLNNAKKIEVAKLAQGMSVIHLYSTHLKSLKLFLPEYKEQQKIAGFLSSIDSKISTVQSQLTHTINFKKGLLQKMFV